MATKRHAKVAAALKGSRNPDVAAAMREAGYGEKFIAGNAAQFPAFLEKIGALSASKAEAAAAKVAEGGDK